MPLPPRKGVAPATPPVPKKPARKSLTCEVSGWAPSAAAAPWIAYVVLPAVLGNITFAVPCGATTEDYVTSAIDFLAGHRDTIAKEAAAYRKST